MRIVSLTCSNTEIVCALGCAHMLVGCDDHSDFPEDVVAALPRVGKDLSPDPEKVAALHPDLVLASLTVPGHEKVVASMAAAGLPFLAPEPVSIADTYDDIRRIAEALGVPERAHALVAQMDAAMPDRADPDGPTVLVEWWPGPVIAAAKQSWVTELLRRAGGRNALADRDVKSTPLTDEEVCALDPAAVVISWCGVPLSHYRPHIVTQRPAWQQVRAVRTGQVHCITEAFLGRPGPRLVDGYRALRDVVQACHATAE